MIRTCARSSDDNSMHDDEKMILQPEFFFCSEKIHTEKAQ